MEKQAKKARLFYTEEHEWVEVLNETTVRIGITEFAVDQLGDIVYVELPEVDDQLKLEDEFATVESVKYNSGIYAPLDLKVTQVNNLLEDEPETMNEDPLGEGWLVEIESKTAVDTSALLDLAAYEAFIEE